MEVSRLVNDEENDSRFEVLRKKNTGYTCDLHGQYGQGKVAGVIL